ncbi:hypothetical protein VA596_30340 [Amycolatopsis sp., V23-08]|uniref:Uncharacterized protein n=1 Tax=Amycolatopsis heterodermiae TaxID=3110235 RepID=A0ABU5RC90_9PSEU|nr:hypothetical protein [Amycolatopsis sp., V23-08]MEA5363868.1 hypothetical protein [Amycolatopsis sp., V23-08]
MNSDEEERRPGDTGMSEEDESAEPRTLDRGLAPPSVVPEVTSTEPLDRGLAPPDEGPVE